MDSRILSSSCEDLPEPRETSVADYILRRIRETALRGEHSAQIANPTTGETRKYSEFDVLSSSVAAVLKYKHGFRKGDTLIYSAHDGANLHVFLLGVWRAGGVVRSSYPEDTKGGELLERINESSAKFILCDEAQALDCLQIVREVPWKVFVIVFGEARKRDCLRAADFFSLNFDFDFDFESDFESDKNGSLRSCDELLTAMNNGNANSQDRGSDIALILPTSGTTGKSKGAVYTHKLVIKTLALLETLPLNGNGDDDPTAGNGTGTTTLFLGKQTHVSGCLIALARITSGHSLLMLTQVSTPAIIQTVRSYRPRSLFLFPKYLTELVQDQIEHHQEYDLSCVHYVCTAGMVVAPALVKTAKKLPKLKAFMMCYGMSECALFTTNVEWISTRATNNNLLTKPICDIPAYSCGKLVPGTSLIVRAVDNSELELNNNDQDTGTGRTGTSKEDAMLIATALGPGQLGELYFKSPIAFTVYLKNPQQTAETLTSSGWIRTGDLGYYDKHGFVYVTDRVKETFKYFNNHISPTEIEQVILGHEAVAEACVLGVHDPQGGDMIARAFVVLKSPKQEPNSSKVVDANANFGIADNIREFTNNLLPSYKQLKGGLYIIPKLPYGKTGKLCRDALKKRTV